ncbi:hypothetical protein A3D77_01430 [Candidatus Gottesmanbacteria bacterium RIFCSPHIGHO2_02_FULL_39_11]|uniref:Uncharacterized protein n=1 Tax=Candidatus Gottesmanbacteria bacterium RIFCSPHIGHO2_02_FULL_39_11 TaxID=1798382 RepID=A0A1F5ZTD0_9BACT|nr:MAG: hypothetical protein A3D77_01430 [Candidatus Gottesmanbacteria bacterium RIFCSPHIGHO2_02_FULL_39_11]
MGFEQKTIRVAGPLKNRDIILTADAEHPDQATLPHFSVIFSPDPEKIAQPLTVRPDRVKQGNGLTPYDVLVPVTNKATVPTALRFFFGVATEMAARREPRQHVESWMNSYNGIAQTLFERGQDLGGYPLEIQMNGYKGATDSD